MNKIAINIEYQEECLSARLSSLFSGGKCSLYTSNVNEYNEFVLFLTIM